MSTRWSERRDERALSLNLDAPEKWQKSFSRIASSLLSGCQGRRDIDYVSDLTFGEYIRPFDNQTRWDKLDLNINRVWFANELDSIRDIRNDLMHFDPDGIEEVAVEALRKFAALLQQLAELKAI